METACLPLLGLLESSALFIYYLFAVSSTDRIVVGHLDVDKLAAVAQQLIARWQKLTGLVVGGEAKPASELLRDSIAFF
ncbi:hypothetical protein PC121_g9103 [Phytophthora cactorum]|nr:hypothetical protein PC120_g12521 [Phytophthora cactorum]KAG3071917.1 hypothetical protein PC121_g9103 [Phytophthora cactorum]